MKSSVKKYDSKRKLQEGEKAGQQKRKKEEISGMKRENHTNTKIDPRSELLKIERKKSRKRRKNVKKHKICQNMARGKEGPKV